jgi:hypothetical protein
LRACGLALAVEGGACEVVESADEPGGAIRMRGDTTGQSRMSAPDVRDLQQFISACRPN